MQRLGCGAGFESAVRRLPDYEPDELPGCSTPLLELNICRARMMKATSLNVRDNCFRTR